MKKVWLIVAALCCLANHVEAGLVDRVTGKMVISPIYLASYFMAVPRDRSGRNVSLTTIQGQDHAEYCSILLGYENSGDFQLNSAEVKRLRSKFEGKMLLVDLTEYQSCDVDWQNLMSYYPYTVLGVKGMIRIHRDGKVPGFVVKMHRGDYFKDFNALLQQDEANFWFTDCFSEVKVEEMLNGVVPMDGRFDLTSDSNPWTTAFNSIVTKVMFQGTLSILFTGTGLLSLLYFFQRSRINASTKTINFVLLLNCIQGVYLGIIFYGIDVGSYSGFFNYRLGSASRIMFFGSGVALDMFLVSMWNEVVSKSSYQLMKRYVTTLFYVVGSCLVVTDIFLFLWIFSVNAYGQFETVVIPAIFTVLQLLIAIYYLKSVQDVLNFLDNMEKYGGAQNTFSDLIRRLANVLRINMAAALLSVFCFVIAALMPSYWANPTVHLITTYFAAFARFGNMLGQTIMCQPPQRLLKASSRNQVTPNMVEKSNSGF